MKIRITLTEDMLGTKAANKDVFADFIASKAPDDDARKQELDTAEHREEAGTTVFHRNENGELMIWDYQIKGFLKEAGNTLRQANISTVAEGGRKGKKWGAIKGKIDNFVMVTPRIISLGKDEPDGICERPLRCETMKGPRVSVARSEVVSAGTSFECEIKTMKGGPVSEAMMREMLDYGAWKGLGQWRNSGKGRFEWAEVA